MEPSGPAISEQDTTTSSTLPTSEPSSTSRATPSVSPSATPSPESSPSATTEGRRTPATDLRAAMPRERDPEYVERVLAPLDELLGDAVARVAEAGTVDAEFVALAEAVYLPTPRDQFLTVWAESADIARTDPGAVRTTVGRVLTWEPGCIVAAVDRDFSAWVTTDLGSTPQRYVGLVAADVPQGRNATGWRLAYDGWQSDGGLPADPCGP